MQVLRTYKNLHDYLDVLFANCDPSEAEIVDAKKAYWRGYNNKIIQERRRQKSEFVVALDKNELKLVHSKMTKEKSVTEYLRNLVNNSLVGNSSNINPRFDTAIIEQQLFLIVENLMELNEQEAVVDKSMVESLEAKVSKVLNHIEQELDNQK